MKRAIYIVVAVVILVSGNLYAVETKNNETLFPIVKNEKWGYMDKTGKVIIEPQFDRADHFSEGIAPIMMGNKVGYIDRTGQIIIPPQFDDGWAFSGGLAPVKIGKHLGYIDRTGKYVWNPSN